MNKRPYPPTNTNHTLNKRVYALEKSFEGQDNIPRKIHHALIREGFEVSKALVNQKLANNRLRQFYIDK